MLEEKQEVNKYQVELCSFGPSEISYMANLDIIKSTVQQRLLYRIYKRNYVYVHVCVFHTDSLIDFHSMIWKSRGKYIFCLLCTGSWKGTLFVCFHFVFEANFSPVLSFLNLIVIFPLIKVPVSIQSEKSNFYLKKNWL